MAVIATIKYADWRRIFQILLALFISVLAGRIIVNRDFMLVACLVFSAIILILYLKQFEFLILLILIINHEFFYLIPGGISGRECYQDLLYVIIILASIGFFWGGKRQYSNRPLQSNCYQALHENMEKGVAVRSHKAHPDIEEPQYKGSFKLLVIFFLIITTTGIFNSYIQGQPFILSLKAAKHYFLILFYFVFISQEINQQKLFRLIIIMGLLLSIVNNIIYFFGNLGIFAFDLNAWQERAGRLRFLIGGFFIIFASIITFGEYLRTNKKLYLMVFIYMAATLILQGMTRAVMFGMGITIPLMIYYSRGINYIKAAFAILILILLFICFIPLLQSSFLGEMYKNTKSEIGEKAGNVGIRLEGYKYYYHEILKSPIIGRGIWNDTLTKGNPEDMKYRRIHLSDIGITILIFHFGILGLLWLVVVLLKVYKISFQNPIKLNENIHYGLIGYFIFNIVTLPTLHCFIRRDVIVYFALTLALLNQSNYLSKDHLRLR